MVDCRFQPETLAIHVGPSPDDATGARTLPIFQTTRFMFDSADHAASLFTLHTFGDGYPRLSKPTVVALEVRVAALAGGRSAAASASGMAAGALHGGTVTMLAVSLAKFGISVTIVDATPPWAIAAAIRPNTGAGRLADIGSATDGIRSPNTLGHRQRCRVLWFEYPARAAVAGVAMGWLVPGKSKLGSVLVRPGTTRTWARQPDAARSQNIREQRVSGKLRTTATSRNPSGNSSQPPQAGSQVEPGGRRP